MSVKRKALIWFLKSTYLRQIVTGVVGVLAAWLVSRGCPPEFQEQIVSTGMALIMLVCQIMAELILKAGNREAQHALGVKRDGVILTDGETVQAARDAHHSVPHLSPGR